MDFIKTFADILKAMLYRLLRSRMTLVFILILVISIMCGIAALKAIGANTAICQQRALTSRWDCRCLLLMRVELILLVRVGCCLCAGASSL